MGLSAASAWIRETHVRRATGSLISLWICLVIAAAVYSAIDDNLTLYEWPMLALLGIGVPVALAALALSASLAGKRVIATIALVAALILGTWFANRELERQRFEEQVAAERQKRAQYQAALRDRCSKLVGTDDQLNLTSCLIREERRDRMRANGASEEAINLVVR